MALVNAFSSMAAVIQLALVGFLGNKTRCVALQVTVTDFCGMLWMTG